MRYWLNVYWAGSVYLDLRFYTAWARSGHLGHVGGQGCE